MQTFVPYADLARSAAVLDDRRLGKQRVETLQVLRALHLEGYGWSSHPAVTMWRGHTPALVAYGVAVVDEWLRRGYADTTREPIAEFVHPDPPPSPAALDREGRWPAWWGDEAVHRSHRSALLRKDRDHYAPAFDGTPDDLPYVWPDPPAPAPPPGARSAWVVRGRISPAAVACDVEPGDLPWVPLDARTGRIRKRDRQVARLVDEMSPGDLVVVPDGGRLRVGRVTGGHRRSRDRHRRPVEWLAVVERADLRFPAGLQDPQVVFALRDEPLLDELAATA